MPAHRAEDLTKLRRNLTAWLCPGNSYVTMYTLIASQSEKVADKEQDQLIRILEGSFPENSASALDHEERCRAAQGGFLSQNSVKKALTNWADGTTNVRGGRLSYERVSFIACAIASAALEDDAILRRLVTGVRVEIRLPPFDDWNLSKGELSALTSAYIVFTSTLKEPDPEQVASIMEAASKTDIPPLTKEVEEYLELMKLKSHLLNSDKTVYGYYDLEIDEVYSIRNFAGKNIDFLSEAAPGRPILAIGSSMFGKSAFIQASVHELATDALRANGINRTKPCVPFLIEIDGPGTANEFHPNDAAPYQPLAELMSHAALFNNAQHDEPANSALSAAASLGRAAIVFVDGSHNVADQASFWKACADLSKQLPEAAFVIAVHQPPPPAIRNSAFLASSSQKKLAPLDEDQAQSIARTYCIQFSQEDDDSKIENAMNVMGTNPYMKKLIKVPGKLMYCAHSLMTSPGRTPYTIIRTLVERKAGAFCPPSFNEDSSETIDMNRQTLQSLLGVVALNDILRSDTPETLRIDGAFSGEIHVSDFPAVLAQAHRIAIGGEPNVVHPKYTWRAFAQELVSRAGILTEDEDSVVFVSALEEAFLAAQRIASIPSLMTESNEAAFQGLIHAIERSILKRKNFAAELTSMVLVALSDFNDEKRHEQLIDALLARAHDSEITSEEAVRILFILEVASQSTLGETLCYPMEVRDEETGGLRNTMEPIEGAVSRLRSFVNDSASSLFERHKRREVGPGEPLTTTERLDYLGVERPY